RRHDQAAVVRHEAPVLDDAARVDRGAAEIGAQRLIAGGGGAQLIAGRRIALAERGVLGIDLGGVLGIDLGSVLRVDLGGVLRVDLGGVLGVDLGGVLGIDLSGVLGVDLGSVLRVDPRSIPGI